jgi:hypothetical protein
MIVLPTELWINIFEKVESIPDLWEFRSVSRKVRSAALYVLKCRVKSDDDFKFIALIENIHTKESDAFILRPISLSDYSLTGLNIGARGLSDKISTACHCLQEKDPDSLKSLDQVFSFVQSACTQVEAAIPGLTKAAYNSIFRHIANSTTSLDKTSISYHSLIEFLCNIWKVLDVITPATLRDAHFCSEDECSCNRQISLKLIKDETILYEGLIPTKEAETSFAWKNDQIEYYFETSHHEISQIGNLKLNWIKCKSDGQNDKRILSAEFKSQPLLIFKLLNRA